MQKLLVIGGCTAVGKSNFALKLSEYLNMEIISADSIQVYKGLEIATSKPTLQEQQKCKHHLIDIVSPFDNFNAYNFVEEAKKYIDSLIYGFDFETAKHKSNYDFYYVYLTDERENIYRKINIRVDKMIEKGLMNEVKALRKIGVTENCQCMQAIGYKEIWNYLDGEYSLEQAIDLIKKNTRNYAKRQNTWFSHNKDCVQWNVQDEEKLIDYLIKMYPEYKK